LRKPAPRIVKIEGPDGQPIIGATISPRLVFIGAGSITAELPNTAVVLPLADTTGPDGKATLTYFYCIWRLTAPNRFCDNSFCHGDSHEGRMSWNGDLKRGWMR